MLCRCEVWGPRMPVFQPQGARCAAPRGCSLGPVRFPVGAFHNTPTQPGQVTRGFFIEHPQGDRSSFGKG